jgi:hypothetical protein
VPQGGRPAPSEKHRVCPSFERLHQREAPSEMAARRRSEEGSLRDPHHPDPSGPALAAAAETVQLGRVIRRKGMGQSPHHRSRIYNG